jgi:hypothetical protein
MRQVGAQLDLVEGCYRAGDGARFARMQQADARLLQRAKAAIRADGSSPGSLMGSGDGCEKVGGCASRVSVCTPLCNGAEAVIAGGQPQAWECGSQSIGGGQTRALFRRTAGLVA